MAGLVLKNLYKYYPGDVLAVDNFNLEIKDKEFIVLVGPSGCGKSTLLRMIAGLEEISKSFTKGIDIREISEKLCNLIR